MAQEKTGEHWVDKHLYGSHTRGEFEHAEVSVFVGKNPWMSHSFPRARVVLNEIAKDPRRSMIVIDPVLTDTARMADFHLRVRPGTDAWCLAAMAAVLVKEKLCNDAFLAEHFNGADSVREVLSGVPVTDFAAQCGVGRVAACCRAMDRDRRQCCGVRTSASNRRQTHTLLVLEQAVVNTDRQLR